MTKCSPRFVWTAVLVLAPIVAGAQEYGEDARRRASVPAPEFVDRTPVQQLLYEREVRRARERHQRMEIRRQLGISLLRPNVGRPGIRLGPTMIGPYPDLVWSRPVIVVPALPRR